MHIGVVMFHESTRGSMPSSIDETNILYYSNFDKDHYKSTKGSMH